MLISRRRVLLFFIILVRKCVLEDVRCRRCSHCIDLDLMLAANQTRVCSYNDVCRLFCSRTDECKQSCGRN